MRKQLLPYILVLFLTATFAGCKKNNIEDQILTVSRLYISNAEIDSTISNITVFDPADANPFSSPYNFASKLPGSAGIFFDPFSNPGTVYQVGNFDKKVKIKKIKLFTVSQYGILTDKSFFVDSSLISPREIAFSRDSNLYISSDSASAIYVYKNPAGLSGLQVKPTKKFKLNGNPWGIHLNKDSLFVVMDLTKREVQLYPNVSKLDSGIVNPTQKITINGAIRLHGITYSAKQDVLIVTDIGEETAAGFNTDGKIYIIESAKAKFTSGIPVTPTRIITGVNTGLGNPVDVSYDERNDKNLIYVAEKANKKILVFRLTDTGNVTPTIVQALNTTPEAIYLDAR